MKALFLAALFALCAAPAAAQNCPPPSRNTTAARLEAAERCLALQSLKNAAQDQAIREASGGGAARLDEVEAKADAAGRTAAAAEQAAIAASASAASAAADARALSGAVGALETRVDGHDDVIAQILRDLNLGGGTPPDPIPPPAAAQTQCAQSLAALAACHEALERRVGALEGGKPPEAPPGVPAIADKPTAAEASRFLQQATFGPTEAEINELVSLGYSEWFRRQLALPKTSASQDVTAKFEDYNRRGVPLGPRVITDFAYRAQVAQKDQLRQRMVFALSQILVVSIEGKVEPQAVADYIDILNDRAFGDYRALLEDITYSPAMAYYLTYLNNQKADAATGAVPDENYAREIMQLFTIGLVELNADGTPKTDAQGRQIETYSNADITGLAKVFTGLSWADESFGGLYPERDRGDLYFKPLKMWPEQHSPEQKTFLARTIPAGASGEKSIDIALDTLFAHPNIAPFISRQLIQRFVTSNPTPQYVQRVANAFAAGAFVLPDGKSVGARTRGDLAAVLAAILFDTEARDLSRREDPGFGRIREPALRFAHWARVSDVNTPTILGANGLADNYILQEAHREDIFGQLQYRSPSVFNFYRPGFVSAGSETAAAGLVAPELQITTTSTVPSYANWMMFLTGNPSDAASFVAAYLTFLPLADRPEALVEKLNLVMTANALSADTRAKIVTALKEAAIRPDRAEEDGRNRVILAMLMITLSPEYAVLR